MNTGPFRPFEQLYGEYMSPLFTIFVSSSPVVKAAYIFALRDLLQNMCKRDVKYLELQHQQLEIKENLLQPTPNPDVDITKTIQLFIEEAQRICLLALEVLNSYLQRQISI